MASRLKDPFCGISHWVGLALSIVGTACLLRVSAGKPVHLLAFSLYGLGLSGLYLASATYHSVDGRPWLRKADHAAIYTMIAGSYAPVCLIALRGPVGSAMMAAQGLFAVAGIALTLSLQRVPGPARVILYLGMGWMALAALGSLQRNLPSQALIWLFLGGVMYSIGAVVYVTDRPSLVPGKFSAHDLWHVFVLVGSACHFVLMFGFIRMIK